MEILMVLLQGIAMSSFSAGTEKFQGFDYNSLKLPTEKVSFKNSLTKQEFDEDILLLRYAIERAYGAKGTVDDKIFENVDTALKKLEFNQEPRYLCKEVSQILSDFPDQHLKAKYRGNFCSHRKVKKINVGKNLNDTEKNWKGIKTKENFYTIAISRFPSGEWPDFFKFVNEAVENAKAIIIDLRGNQGGNDSTGLKLAEKLAGQKIETPHAPDIYRNTPETLTIYENILKAIKRDSKYQNERNHLDVYIEEILKKRRKVLNGKIEEFTTRPIKKTKWKYDTSKGYRGPIYILQDKDCVSSGESTIDFFEYFPNVTRVGFNTAGMTHFGDVGAFVLPNSSIQINMPTKSNRYKDGRFIEFEGIKPDILLQDGQDAYEYALSLLKKKKL